MTEYITAAMKSNFFKTICIFYINAYTYICVATYICSESILLISFFTYWPKLYILIYYAYRIVIADLVQ